MPIEVFYIGQPLIQWTNVAFFSSFPIFFINLVSKVIRLETEHLTPIFNCTLDNIFAHAPSQSLDLIATKLLINIGI
jgi:hypothetical protein